MFFSFRVLASASAAGAVADGMDSGAILTRIELSHHGVSFTTLLVSREQAKAAKTRSKQNLDLIPQHAVQ
jgi:hypothetical protein